MKFIEEFNFEMNFRFFIGGIGSVADELRGCKFFLKIAMKCKNFSQRLALKLYDEKTRRQKHFSTKTFQYKITLQPNIIF